MSDPQATHPTSAMFRSADDLLPKPTPAEWKTARQDLEVGDGKALADVLRKLDEPIVLVEVFAAALADEAECKRIIAEGGDRNEVATLRSEQTALLRMTPGDLDTAKQIGRRQHELEGLIAVATNRAEFAKQASEALAWLHWYFADFFGVAPAKEVHRAGPSIRIDQVLLKFDLDPSDTWRGMERHGDIQEPRRKIVAFAPEVVTRGIQAVTSDPPKEKASRKR